MTEFPDLTTRSGRDRFLTANTSFEHLGLIAALVIVSVLSFAVIARRSTLANGGIR
jgi:hypothetical protein